MLVLTENEIRELRILACFNDGSIERDNLAESLYHLLCNHNFYKEPEVRIAITKRTLLLFAGYADKWDATDSLGQKLIAERELRLAKAKQKKP